MKRFGIVTNHWGWTLRGIREWVGVWSFPWTMHGVEVTNERPLVYRGPWPAPLHVIDRILKVGPFWMKFGTVTQGYDDGQPTYFDKTGQHVVRYPYGRLQAWRSRRRLEQIERENARRATDRAMREGWS